MTYKIKNHRLVDHWFGKSEDVGGRLSGPRYIVMHYTAGGSGAGTRDYLMKSPAQKGALRGLAKKIYASAHLVVDRDGTVWQIVPFNLKARHAGTSFWRGQKSLNQCSIGIEIANYGWLNQQADGSYKRDGTPRFSAADVSIGKMPNSDEIKGWENYPEAQLQALEDLTLALLDRYPSIEEIVGHQEIAPRRKFDPGPAFPMQRFRNLHDGRGGGELDGESQVPGVPIRYRTTTRLNIRGGAGTSFEKLEESPLATGTELQLVETSGQWLFVSLRGDGAVKGWVHGGYVERLESTA